MRLTDPGFLPAWMKPHIPPHGGEVKPVEPAVDRPDLPRVRPGTSYGDRSRPDDWL